jgi:hypothetical protein
MMRAVMGIAFILVGCGGPAADSPSTAASAAEPSEPAVSAAGTAAASEASGESVLCAVGHEPCPIEAGTYTAAPFEPNFSFTVDEGWQNDRAFADGGGISKPEGGFFWASGIASGTIGGEEIEIGASVDDFVTFLHGFEAIGMTVSESTSVTVDGISGQQIDVEANDAEAPALYRLAEDQFNLVPGEKARFLVLDKDGETVLLIVDSFTTEGFEDWLRTAQPVVDSISWEE